MNLIEKTLQQSAAIKQQYPDVLLLFRMGDFYEAFNDDAKTIALAANLTLTRRADTPMVGFPRHSADRYIARLNAAGFRVAVCEDAEPDYAETSDKITRVVTEAAE